MSRKMRILSLALGGVCLFGASRASAQLLAGNVWPNSGFNVPAAPGVDQVYSYYNGTYSSGGAYTPNTTGDANPRPAGWHRGGVDFGATSAPEMLFYNPAEGSNLNTPPSGNSLEIDDQDTGNYGEWFSDWNALPAASVNGAAAVNVQFLWEYTNLASTQRPTDQFRVTVYFGDSVGDDTLTAPNQLGNGTDELLTIPGTADETSWTQVDEMITPPAGAQSMRITIDSGGSAQATGQLWVDDISVAAVPEPTSLGLLSAGALLLARRRRQA